MEDKKLSVTTESLGICVDDTRRKCLVHAIAALAHEIGYDTVERSALEALTDFYIKEMTDIGRMTRLFSEAASRIESTVGDFSLAMIELGLPIDPVAYRAYSRRHTRPTVPNPPVACLPKVPQVLSAGKRRGLPPYIPDYFPPMPDSHTYIRTPTHKQPLTDYAVCREKMSQQKRDLERSLSKFYARTSPCFYFFPDNKDLFPLMLPKHTTYHDAVICRDQIFEEEQSLPPINFIKLEKEGGTVQRLNDDEENQDIEMQDSQPTWELIDNPFLRPAVQGSFVRKLKTPKSEIPF